MKNNKNNFGQYFTPKEVAEFMIELASINQTGGKILEPCSGEGIFLKLLDEKGFKDITAYEIDNSLSNTTNHKVIYESFISKNTDKKYDLVIGPPPYIRWKNLEDSLKAELSGNYLWNKYFNSLCDYLYIFILKSIEHLNEGGELIFICPEYWLNTTHSISLRNYMVENGYFEKIYHFNETPIFEKVTVSIIIFKYIKKKEHHSPKISLMKYHSKQRLTKQQLADIKIEKSHPEIDFTKINQFKTNERWILAPDEIKAELKTFEEKCSLVGNIQLNNFDNSVPYHTIGELCDIGNGLVSGLDGAFQINTKHLNELELQHTMNVIKAKDLKPFYSEKITHYIFVNDGLSETEFKENYPNFYKHLFEFKELLSKRYNYNRPIKFWEWVFLRNFNLFSRPEKRIFVPCKERISNKNYFRFALVEQNNYPTQDVTALFKKPKVKESIYYLLAMLNNHRAFNWLKYNGIVKGNIVEFSEKPIASMPIRLIDWNNEDEVKLHDKITEACKLLVESRNDKQIKILDSLTDTLFSNTVVRNIRKADKQLTII